MGVVDIREIAVRDYGAVVGLIGELGYTVDVDLLDRRLRAARGDGDGMLVASVDGRVVGVIAAVVVPLLAEADAMVRITTLSVTASMRGPAWAERWWPLLSDMRASSARPSSRSAAGAVLSGVRRIASTRRSVRRRGSDCCQVLEVVHPMSALNDPSSG